MVGTIRKLSDLSKDVKSLINMITHKRAKSTFRQASGGDDNQFGKTMVPVDFAHRLFRRNLTKAPGGLQYKGELKNSTKFNKDNTIPPIFDKEYEMVAAVMNSAKSGQNIPAIEALSGQANVSAANASAAAHASNINKENEENAEDPIEALLRRIYRLITGLEPLDENGNETTPYVKFKELYQALIIEMGDDFIAYYYEVIVGDGATS